MSDTRYEHLVEMLKQTNGESEPIKTTVQTPTAEPVNEVAVQLKKLFQENIGSLVLDKEYDFESHMTIFGRNNAKVNFKFRQVWRMPRNYEIGCIEMNVKLGFFNKQQEKWCKYDDIFDGCCNPNEGRKNTFFSDEDWDDFDKIIRGQMRKLIASENNRAQQDSLNKASNLLKEVCGDETEDKIVAQLIHKDM
jgi:hypothetical protein